MSKLRKKCHECGADYLTVKKDARFCGTKCRKSYNNRRAVRGAELYDLFMASLYDRQWSDQNKIRSKMAALACHWNQQDHNRGFKSWQRPVVWLRDNCTWLAAQIMVATKSR